MIRDLLCYLCFLLFELDLFYELQTQDTSEALHEYLGAERRPLLSFATSRTDARWTMDFSPRFPDNEQVQRETC